MATPMLSSQVITALLFLKTPPITQVSETKSKPHRRSNVLLQFLYQSRMERIETNILLEFPDEENIKL
jgi:hypothetical protein